MKKIVPFFFSFFLIACSQQESQKENVSVNSESAIALDTFTIGTNTFYIKNLGNNNFIFPTLNANQTGDSVAIQKNKNLVSRNNDSLFFICDNGKTVKLVNNRGEEDYSVFDFIDLNTEIDYFVVRHSLMEGRNFILINKKSGQPLETIGIPVVSPDKKHFACGNCDLVAAFDVTGIEFFKAGNNAFKSIGLRQLTEWGPQQMAWKDDTTLIIEATVASKDEMQNQLIYKAIFIK